MRTDDFDYHLPRELVAQVPTERRGDSRLMVLPRAEGPPRHAAIADLLDLLSPGDLLVGNDTRVLAARLFGRRVTGGRVEFLFLSPGDDGTWSALVKAGGSLRPGERISGGGDDGSDDWDGAGVELVERLDGGAWRVRVVDGAADELMAHAGKLPLPPYIRRERSDPRDALDRDRYQTVFARRPGAVAAPTAGLHLTEALLARLRERGVGFETVTLHVGLGTFLPVTVERVEDHPMHAERFEVAQRVVDAVTACRAAGGRVVAVGTTSVRALEAAAAAGELVSGRAETDLFILPGHDFRVVDGLLTNFHLPRSTLLCLVSALVGRERLLAAYDEAVARRYRFYSYGDAMLVL